MRRLSTTTDSYTDMTETHDAAPSLDIYPKNNLEHKVCTLENVGVRTHRAAKSILVSIKVVLRFLKNTRRVFLKYNTPH